MPFRPGVNFINILRAGFMLVDTESIKKIENLTVFFMLLRTTGVKAAHKYVDEIEP